MYKGLTLTLRILGVKNVRCWCAVLFSNVFAYYSVADLGEGPREPLFWVNKAEMIEERKAGWASKVKQIGRASCRERV